MEVAAHLQWIVPLAIVIAGGLITLTRSVVSHETTISVFNIFDKTKSFGSYDRIGSGKIKLMNTSYRHLKDVHVIFRSVDVLAFGQFKGSTLGDISLPTLGTDGNLDILIPQMPARERVSIDILYANATSLGFASVSGGGNSYRICESELNRLQRQAFWLRITVGAVISFFVIAVWRH